MWGKGENERGREGRKGRGRTLGEGKDDKGGTKWKREKEV